MADTPPAHFRRFSAARVTTALEDTPVVMVNGPRQMTRCETCAGATK